jgi:hypothetical protein
MERLTPSELNDSFFRKLILLVINFLVFLAIILVGAILRHVEPITLFQSLEYPLTLLSFALGGLLGLALVTPQKLRGTISILAFDSLTGFLALCLVVTLLILRDNI